MKYLYSKNFKILKNIQINTYARRWKDILWSLMGNIIIVEIIVLP